LNVYQIFIDKATTIEDLMRDKGQLVKKGSLSEDGDLEFWDDGTTTRRDKWKSYEKTAK
jgi:mitochondrial protein import protein ZIM17